MSADRAGEDDADRDLHGVEAALRANEARLRATFDNAGVGIVETDSDGRFIAVNDRACEILGRSREELLKRTVFDVTSPENCERSQDVHAVVRRGSAERVGYEKRYIRGDGSTVWVYVTVSAVHDEAGRWLRSISTIEDVSERKAAEEDLRRSQAQLQTIVENLAEGLVVSDLDGRLFHWNRAALDMHGFASLDECQRLLSEFVDIFELSTLDGRVLSMDEWPLPRIMRGERLRGLELCLRRIDKDWERVYSYGGTLVRDGEGRPLMAVLTITDVTRRKHDEEELKKAKAAAEEANQAKDHFLAVLSHELRTPLAPVLTGLSLLERHERLSARGREYLEVIRRNVELESRLIDDLLDLTRIARGKVVLDRQRVALQTIIERAVEVCRPDIEARRLHFGVDLCSPPVLVDADAARLQQVFWNLLKNSIKFTPPGGCLGVRCEHREGEAVVEVSDSGIGIERAALDRIFDAFAQGERVTRQFGGLGLGLAISKALVTMHGGAIEAESEGPNLGATFRVRLPVAGVPLEERLPSAGRAESPGPSRPLRVLLVEDHGDTAEMMATVLGLEGFDVETAGDVASALELASKSDYDVLLSDLGLPDRSGLDLMRDLRARGSRMPGIALSGYGQDRDVEQSQDAGFAAHLVKPVEPRRLVEAMQRVVSRSAGEDERPA